MSTLEQMFGLMTRFLMTAIISWSRPLISRSDRLHGMVSCSMLRRTVPSMMVEWSNSQKTRHKVKNSWRSRQHSECLPVLRTIGPWLFTCRTTRPQTETKKKKAGNKKRPTEGAGLFKIYPITINQTCCYITHTVWYPPHPIVLRIQYTLTIL